MRPGIIGWAFLSLLSVTVSANAQHGHVASAPQAPHYSAPHFSQPVFPHFNQAMAPHFNPMSGLHSNVGAQGLSGPSFSARGNAVPMGRYVNRTTTRLHALSNALQENHAIAGHDSAPSTRSRHSASLAKNSAGSKALNEGPTAAGGSLATKASHGKSATAATTNPANNPSAASTSANTATGSTTTAPGSSTTATGSTSPPTGGGSVTPPATKPTTSTANNTGTPTGTTTTSPSIGSITPTSPNLSTSGNPTNLNPVSNPAMFNSFTSAPILNLGLGYGFGGMYGLVTTPNGHHYYVYYPYAYGGLGYGNRNYGNRYYNNANNTMYFAQMRRLSRLVNDLNNLTQGANAAPAMSARLYSDLMGVVFNNVRPPQQPVQQLSTDLATILPSRTVPMMNTGELAQSLMVVMNGGGQNPLRLQNSIAGAQGIMSMSGVPQAGIQTISSDLMMVATGGNAGNGQNALQRIR